MAKKISVIVPVFNSEKYIGRCLKSICENSYKELEIIVIDDGSSDKSGTICNDYAQSDDRIRVIHQKNQGVSKSRNYGIRLATGDYVAFVDSDDMLPKDFYDSLVLGIEEGIFDLCICSISYVYENNIQNIELDNFNIHIDNGSSQQKKMWYKLNKAFLLYGPCNKLYKADIIRNNNITFPVDTSYGEDLLFNMEYLNYCKNIKYLRYPCYFYYKNNENSLSYIYRENRFINGLRLNKSINIFSNTHNLNSNQLSKYILELAENEYKEKVEEKYYTDSKEKLNI